MYDSDIVEKSRTVFFEGGNDDASDEGDDDGRVKVEYNDQSSIDESLDECINQADENEEVSKEFLGQVRKNQLFPLYRFICGTARACLEKNFNNNSFSFSHLYSSSAT